MEPSLLDGAPFDLTAAHIARFEHARSLASTMDRAHELAQQGAPSGTMVLADCQEAGRGRGGRRWASEPGAGLWCTLLERSPTPESLDVLALRVGLALAQSLELWSPDPLRLKWPNDLVVRDSQSASVVAYRKLAGVLVEARWQGAQPEWVAIGIGLNLREPEAAPDGTRAAWLAGGVTRAQLLTTLTPAVRAAAQRSSPLSETERSAWHSRDIALGHRIVSPAEGIVEGIDVDGALLVQLASGDTRRCRSGSLIFFSGSGSC